MLQFTVANTRFTVYSNPQRWSPSRCGFSCYLGSIVFLRRRLPQPLVVRLKDSCVSTCAYPTPPGGYIFLVACAVALSCVRVRARRLACARFSFFWLASFATRRNFESKHLLVLDSFATRADVYTWCCGLRSHRFPQVGFPLPCAFASGFPW